MSRNTQVLPSVHVNVKLLLFALLIGTLQAREVLWRDPGAVERLDLTSGPGGRALKPRAPFTFVREETGGTKPKMVVRDGTGRMWMVKWGREARPEVFATRMVWALGYHAQPAWFVKSGWIRGVPHLKRKTGDLEPDGGFRDARFQLMYDHTTQPLKGHNWALVNNPFLGTHEFAGLKILAMLLSNRDLKDARSDRGINTIILKRPRELVYAVSDWGNGMGKWARNWEYITWNCDEYARQTERFVRYIHDDGQVVFGYKGTNGGEVRDDIALADVRWFMKYAGRLTDRQIRQALDAAGATPEEAACFGAALRDRIEQLRSVARVPSASVSGNATRSRQSVRARRP